jgi:hypothetical protein
MIEAIAQRVPEEMLMSGMTFESIEISRKEASSPLLQI